MTVPRHRGLTEQAADAAVDQACKCDDRARRRSERRIKAAGFPRQKSLREFDFEANPNIDPAMIHSLATSDWVRKGLPLCLIGDYELGYMELDRRGAELLFQVITERDERASIAIASNESFSGWTKTFTDPRLCAAIVYRLTYGGNIIETGTVSYRYTQTQAVKSAQQAPS
ncbi:MAG: ATPase [Nonomuraea muscovyensis]|nr:ATPase [Nonomuraea muscovyensis]